MPKRSNDEKSILGFSSPLSKLMTGRRSIDKMSKSLDRF